METLVVRLVSQKCCCKVRADGKITAVEIHSNSGAECVIKYPNAKDLKVSGAKVKVFADDQISFATVKGKTYIIKNVSSL